MWTAGIKDICNYIESNNITQVVIVGANLKREWIIKDNVFAFYINTSDNPSSYENTWVILDREWEFLFEGKLGDAGSWDPASVLP